MKRLWLLFTWATVAAVIDALLTYYYVVIRSEAAEVNPYTRFIVERFGWYGWFFLRVFVFPISLLGLIWMTLWRRKPSLYRCTHLILLLACVFSSIAVGFNLIQLILQLMRSAAP